MEKLDNCPVCNHNSFTHFLSCKDYTVSHESFEIVACSSCGFKFTNPRPTENELGKYYQSEEYVSHSNTSKGLINSLYQVARNYTLVKKLQLVNSVSTKGAILDYGCGTGEFLNVCHSSGWQVTGMEPDEGARNHGINKYQLKVYDDLFTANLPDDHFNLITLWHVLEHVSQLDKTVEELLRILKPNGHLLIALPNCDSHDAKVYKEYWAAYDVPRHLYHFTPETVKGYFSKYNFKVSRLLPMTLDSFYVSMLSEKYLAEEKNRSVLPFYIRAFFRGLTSNIKGAIHPGHHSSQIYILERSN